MSVQRAMESRVKMIMFNGTECILHNGFIDSNGYGRGRYKGKTMRAHRSAWIERNGPIPAGLVIDHLCRNRACVNPDHLEPVTHLENMRRSGLATKTHCVRGHEYTPENTYLRKRQGDGVRSCKTCLRENQRRRYRRIALEKANAHSNTTA